MAKTRIRSSAPATGGERVKIDPNDLQHFLAVVREHTPKQLGVSQRTYWAWLSGDVPKVVRMLLRNPALAQALARDAERLAIREELRAKTE
jgi:predicted DNA-binding protein (UPF0251 family)